jgi:hypothetical protein
VVAAVAAAAAAAALLTIVEQLLLDLMEQRWLLHYFQGPKVPVLSRRRL